ncbi:hypothetical protein ACET3Z_004180 [Daucus carota]
MVFVSRKLNTLTKLSEPWLPFSQRKLLETDLVSKLDNCRNFAQIKQLHAHIIRKGLNQSCYVVTKLLRMLSNVGVPVDKYAHHVFDQVPQRNSFIWTALIRGYCVQGLIREAVGLTGDMDSAKELFDELPVKDMVAWTAMVTGYAQNARPREALNLFKRMQDGNVQTDEVTLVGVISACAQLGAAKYAGWVRNISEESGYRPTSNVVVGSAFVDMYSKCGNVEEAYSIFKRMRERNVYSFSSMIVGFAMHGHATEAINLFEEMVKTKIKPNRVTFVGVLTACSHAGLTEQGEHYFKTMQSCYGVVADADHYACMVDLRGRSGRLEGALQLIKTMPVKPHGGVWGALLGACRIHGDPDIAQIAANSLFELEPNSIGNYILLSNIYASAGRWEDVARVRKAVRMKGLKKNPACSFVEGKDGVIHEFLAGDLTHPRSSQIKRELENLLHKLKFHGYQPVLSSVPYDVDDKEKMRILMAHSEKLAFSYGLLTVASCSTITIVKNLRICEDCHLFMCGASLVTGRKIIIRDNMRFHHFHDGACSCNNFW